MNLFNLARPLAAVLLLAAAACGDDDGPTDMGTPDMGTPDTGTPVDMGDTSATLTSIAITPSPISLEVGGTQALTVTGSFDDGSMSDQTANATFMSNAVDVVTVGATGSVIAASAGTATVTADVNGVMAAVVVTVTEGMTMGPLTIPMTVDDNFQGRAAFGEGGPPLHSEDAMCPMRAGGENGVCHRFVWDGTGGAFTGAFWINGTSFEDINGVPVMAGATEITFWAWGAAGGEVVEFGAGLNNPDLMEPANARAFLTMTTTPTQYTVSVAPFGNYTEIRGAFLVALSAMANPMGATVYVDDIQWTTGNTPSEIPLPMVVDANFTGRAGFGDGGPPGHMEDDQCGTRPMGAMGACHHITWDGTKPDGSASGFTGAFWIDGTGFDNLNGKAVAAGATEISFYAWGAAGGEVVEFGAGLANAALGEAASVRRDIPLTTTPTRYFVRLDTFGAYTDVYGAFIFSMGAAGEIFIDDIQWTVNQAPTGVALPLVIDDNFPDRSAFAGGEFYVEDNMCPMRAGTMAGNCHRFQWSGVGGFTGGFFTIGSDFMNLQSLLVAPGANALTFYAWGMTGGELVEFGAGLDDPESFRVRENITLTNAPVKYVVPLGGGYMGVKGPFVFVLASGAATFYVDDIKWENVVLPTDVRPDPEDRVVSWNGGTPALRDAAIGGATVGDAEAGTNYVIPFRLPAIPMGGFTAANLRVFVASTGGAGMNMLNADLYGLPFRAAGSVAAGDVVQTSMFHSDAAIDPSATLIVDNFLTSTTGNAVNVDTDAAGDTALLNYLNAQVTAGAVAGDIVYLRISPDAVAPIGAAYTWVVEAAVDAAGPPNRPTLTVQ